MHGDMKGIKCIAHVCECVCVRGKAMCRNVLRYTMTSWWDVDHQVGGRGRVGSPTRAQEPPPPL